jgi:hypothetical protein
MKQFHKEGELTQLYMSQRDIFENIIFKQI